MSVLGTLCVAIFLSSLAKTKNYRLLHAGWLCGNWGRFFLTSSPYLMMLPMSNGGNFTLAWRHVLITQWRHAKPAAMLLCSSVGLRLLRAGWSSLCNCFVSISRRVATESLVKFCVCLFLCFPIACVLFVQSWCTYADFAYTDLTVLCINLCMSWTIIVRSFAVYASIYSVHACRHFLVSVIFIRNTALLRI